MRRSASPKIARAAHKRHFVPPLEDVIFLVGRRQHFTLIDVIHAHGFQHLRLGKVADARLGHHRNRHRGHNLLDDLDGRHAGHAAFFANVRRHALQRHDGRGARVLGDLGLLGRGDVHDDAALQHFRQAHFQFHLLIIFPHGITPSQIEDFLASARSPRKASGRNAASSSAPKRVIISGKRLNIRKGSPEIHNTGAQHKRSADDRVGQKSFAALLQAHQQFTVKLVEVLLHFFAARLEVARHIAERSDAQTLPESLQLGMGGGEFEQGFRQANIIANHARITFAPHLANGQPDF